MIQRTKFLIEDFGLQFFWTQFIALNISLIILCYFVYFVNHIVIVHYKVEMINQSRED